MAKSLQPPCPGYIPLYYLVTRPRRFEAATGPESGRSSSRSVRQPVEAVAAMTETSEAAAILAPLWKRKWMILIIAIVVGGATYFYYHRQQPVYGASTQIYLGQSAQVQSQLSGQTATIDTDRAISDQVVLINSNVVGSLVEQRLLARHDLAAAAGRAAASASLGTDFIYISATAHTAQGAADLANAYAQVYLEQHGTSYHRNLVAVLGSLRQHLASVEAATIHNKSATQSSQISDLVSEIDQLDLQLSLGDTGDQQIDPAVASSVPLSPKPTRNALFGFALGLVLASIIAYALSRFARSPTSSPRSGRRSSPSCRPCGGRSAGATECRVPRTS